MRKTEQIKKVMALIAGVDYDCSIPKEPTERDQDFINFFMQNVHAYLDVRSLASEEVWRFHFSHDNHGLAEMKLLEIARVNVIKNWRKRSWRHAKHQEEQS